MVFFWPDSYPISSKYTLHGISVHVCLVHSHVLENGQEQSRFSINTESMEAKKIRLDVRYASVNSFSSSSYLLYDIVAIVQPQ